MKFPLTMPFCRSMTINAVLGSRAVSGIRFFSSDTQLAWVKQDAVGSILNKPSKQCECRLKLLLLLNRELLRDPRGEPVLSRGPALLKPLQAFGRERHQSLPSVAWVGSTTHQAPFLQRHNDSRS